MLSTPFVPLVGVVIVGGLLLVGYLLGSIPFGLLLTRAAGLGDVRTIGSGNIGATNVLRTGNKKIAALTLLCDLLKGTLAVLVGMWIGSLLVQHFLLSDPAAAAHPSGVQMAIARARAETYVTAAGAVAGLGAFLGHVFPVWLGFKGGKGVATFIGVLIAASWKAAAVFAVVWLLTALVTRYSSLSALVATFVVFLFLNLTAGPFVVPVVAIISALLFWAHRANIRRLAAGTESKIGAKG